VTREADDQPVQTLLHEGAAPTFDLDDDAAAPLAVDGADDLERAAVAVRLAVA
jgi:CTP:molybdopterin cytidylyltransferase MocA